MEIQFQPLQEEHFDQLLEWLNEGHVKKYWPSKSNREEVLEEYRSHIRSPTIFPFVFAIRDEPAGYIQAYHDSASDKPWFPQFGEGTWGIDMFIGNPDWIHERLGRLVLRKFVNKVKREFGAQRIVIDPTPENEVAIKCFRAAGFRDDEIVKTPDGEAQLMVFEGLKNTNSLELRPLDKDNYKQLLMLSVEDKQRRFIAPNPVTIAISAFEDDKICYGIFADDQPVGLAMYAIEEEDFEGVPFGGQASLWRLMIAEEYQGYGFGKAALDLVCDLVSKIDGVHSLYLTYVRGEGSPQAFYKKCGFEDLDQKMEGEWVMKKSLKT